MDKLVSYCRTLRYLTLKNILRSLQLKIKILDTQNWVKQTISLEIHHLEATRT